MDDQMQTYMDGLDPKWANAFRELKGMIDQRIPSGFTCTMQNGMPSYVVPLGTYPAGYHCEANTPLPFLSLAAQKKHLALYHMGLYSSPELLGWFQENYPKHMDTKLNMGKSCIRFTNPKKIPYELLGELVSKMSVQDWIHLYETNVER